MGALLCIINLMPIIPSAMANHLSDLFEGFAYLASIPCQSSPKFSNDLQIHLQIGLYCLFNRLYGMFPCNFLSFLRQEYVIKKKTAIYTHTIKPLLDTVKINPLLVTTTKDAEMDPNRWKKMEPHDVVYECSKFSLDFLVKPDIMGQDCQCYSQTNRLMTTSSTSSMQTFENSSSLMETLVNSFQTVTVSESTRKPLLLQMPRNERFVDMSMIDNNVWSPSVMVLATPPPTGVMPHTPTPSSIMSTNYSSQMGQDGSSPPEAAVEATPETTPMKDHLIRTLPSNSSAVRAIWRPQNQPSSGGSTPSSPMKKDSSPVDWKRFPEPPNIISTAPELNSISATSSTAASTQKLKRIINDRTHSIKQIQSSVVPSSGSVSIGRDGQGGINSDSGNDLGTNQMVSNTGEFPHVISSTISIPNSPLPLDAFLSSNNLVIDISSNLTTQEDQEIIDINRSVVQQKQQHQQQELTILPEFATDCDVDCENEVSPCSAGGLHIIDSKSMINFATRRIRMYSHCIGESSFSAGTSPADISHFIEGYGGTKTFVKKSNSWPDLKMTKISAPSPSAFMPVVKKKKLLGRDDINGESGGCGEQMEIISKHLDGRTNNKIEKYDHKSIIEKMNVGTQTIQQWPQFYEHMFLGRYLI